MSLSLTYRGAISRLGTNDGKKVTYSVAESPMLSAPGYYLTTFTFAEDRGPKLSEIEDFMTKMQAAKHQQYGEKLIEFGYIEVNGYPEGDERNIIGKKLSHTNGYVFIPKPMAFEFADERGSAENHRYKKLWTITHVKQWINKNEGAAKPYQIPASVTVRYTNQGNIVGIDEDTQTINSWGEYARQWADANGWTIEEKFRVVLSMEPGDTSQNQGTGLNWKFSKEGEEPFYINMDGVLTGGTKPANFLMGMGDPVTAITAGAVLKWVLVSAVIAVVVGGIAYFFYVLTRIEHLKVNLDDGKGDQPILKAMATDLIKFLRNFYKVVLIGGACLIPVAAFFTWGLPAIKGNTPSSTSPPLLLPSPTKKKKK